jgi:SPP1 gp7 family putative phage head morphogenesis protein
MTQARLKTRTMARKPKPPALDAPASAYAVVLSQLLAPVLTAVEHQVLPLTAPSAPRHDAADFETLSAVFGRLRVGIMQRLLHGANFGAQRTANNVAGRNSQELKRVLRVDPFASEPWLKPLTDDWIAQNVGLVRSVAESALGDLEQVIYRMVREGRSIKDIRTEVRDTFNISKNRAKLIARDQVNKFNGQLTETRQTHLGVVEYIWHDSEDQRVRPDHARLDNKKFKWKSPPITVTSGKRAGERNHPGGDIQCRCWAEPVLEGLLA